VRHALRELEHSAHCTPATALPSRHYCTGRDFFTVPTITFRLLDVFIILSHQHRRVSHVNITIRPTATWISQQLRETFPFETAPRYLIRNRDGLLWRRGTSLPDRLADRGSADGAAFPERENHYYQDT
jgi:hypothetical protein